MAEPRVCVGVIVGAHGVRGQVRVKPFTESADGVAAYGPVEDEEGRRSFRLKAQGEAKGLAIVKPEGVEDRNAAEALKGVRLFVPRARLPEVAEDEFLYADLVGLEARDEKGARLGTVAGIADFGAGEVLEVTLDGGGCLMAPFTRQAVPEVNVLAGWLTVVMPVYAEGGEREDGNG